MKRILIILLPVLFLATSCSLLDRWQGLNPSGDDASEYVVPEWDGYQILCGENVSFAIDATEPLPEFDTDVRLGFCARTMKYLALHRQYGGQTTFFGVAATTTGTLAATYSTLSRRVYSASTWAFMQSLSLALEAKADEVAAYFAAGGTGGARYTTNIIRQEQISVQAALDALQDHDPDNYASVLSDVDRTLNPTNSMLLAGIERNPLLAAYEASLVQVRGDLNGNIDFSDLEHRLKVGAALDRLIANIEPLPQP